MTTKLKTISAYTPSNTDPALLKRVFVQREQLLDRIVDRLSVSMTSGDKHHILLVGPRGSGKTHLVTLANWELKQNPKLADSMRIAWLGEDDTFSGLIHFAFGIARFLADEYPNEFSQDFKSSVRGLPPDDAALAVLQSVIANLKHRHLLLLTENLDHTFQGLGEAGQKKLRAFLQETRRIATLATTQQLFDGVSSRDEAFFGFFEPIHLKPLTVDDAQQLILNIATEQGKTELIQFLNSNKARYRIRALHHLAGGNHRMYVLLAEFLTQDKLDDLVAAFENLAEEMTPYFQERMRSLPHQQRQLVQCLCDAAGAMTVKQLVEETFIAEGNCSKQLGNLKAKGYVRSEKRGKESYYDMAEPLMRLCLEVKNQRGRPLKLVASFLKAWFPEDKLQASLQDVSDQSRLAEYCQLALQSPNSHQALINASLREEIEQKIELKNWKDALELADELSESDHLAGLKYRFKVAYTSSDWTTALNVLDEISLVADAIELKATVLYARGCIYGMLENIQAELIQYNSLIQMLNAPAEYRALALFCRGTKFGQIGNIQAELADYTTLLGMAGISSKPKALALLNRGVAFRQTGDTQKSLADLNMLLQIPDVPFEQKTKGMLLRGITYLELGADELAIEDFTTLMNMPDASSGVEAMSLLLRGAVYLQRRLWQDSKADFSSARSLQGLPMHIRTRLLFLLPEPMVTIDSLQQVVAALANAFEEGDRTCDAYGGTPSDLISMIVQRGPLEWESYIHAIAPLYVEHGVAEKLGNGITQSIKFLDEGDFSASQLDRWYQSWQSIGQGVDELEIPLQCLRAAVEVLKSDPPNDRPLFGLPLEIRELVRPLLKNKLNEA